MQHLRCGTKHCRICIDRIDLKSRRRRRMKWTYGMLFFNQNILCILLFNHNNILTAHIINELPRFKLKLQFLVRFKLLLNLQWKDVFNIIHFSVHLGANSIQLYNKHSKKVWDLHLHHFGLTLIQINPFINCSDISMLVLKFKRFIIGRNNLCVIVDIVHRMYRIYH